MKTKGITFWERYLEYFVLGAAVLVLLTFAALQFLGNPNSVDVPGVGKVGPSQVDSLLEQRATEISQKIGGAGIDIPAPAPVLPRFQEGKMADINPGGALFVSRPRLSPVSGIVVVQRDRPFVVPSIPAPHNLVAQQYFDTLSEETMTDHAELRQIVASAPYDITWITPAATFDVSSVRRQFGEPGPNGEAPLPLKWYNNRVEFIDVKVERQELVNGQWVNSLLLQPIPGQVTVRPKLKGRIDAGTRDEILGIVYDPAPIIRPEFYTGIAAAWAPPDEREEEAAEPTNPEEAALLELRRKVERDRKELERAENRFRQLGCNDQPSQPPTGAGRPGQRPPRGGGGDDVVGGGGGAGTREPGSQTSPAKDAECRRLRTKIHHLREQITRNEAEIERLSPVPVEKPIEVEPEPALPDEYRIWAHDIHIQPGRTYRYRFTVEIYNPLFARKNDLVPTQHELADRFTLASQTSDWSEPVRAEPPLRLFVTAARPAGQGAIAGAQAGNATAEIYRFRDGRWWFSQFTIQPGDRVGGQRAARAGDRNTPAVDFGSDWFLLDIVPDLAAGKDDNDRSWAAMVVLQSLSDPTLVQNRSPREDHQSPQRRFLREELRSAEAGGALLGAR